MANNERVYCRLCAEAKPSNKLVNLQSDDAKKRETMEKLVRINANCLDLCSSDNLPKTVCFVCNDTLDKALDFVSQIRAAQTLLRSIFIEKLIKEESEQLNHNYESNEPDYQLKTLVKDETTTVDVKMEYDVDDNVFDSDDLEPIVHTHKTRKRKAKLKTLEQTLDDSDIPLSKLKCMTWKDYPWLCAYCNCQFFTVEELKNHSIATHNSCMPYKCINCRNNTRKSLDKFLMHVSKHKRHLKLCCYLCNTVVSSKEKVELHKLEHENKNNMKCKGCNTYFNSYDHLKEHMDRFYKNKLKTNVPESITASVTCKICSKTFMNRGNLNKHIQIHTERRREQTCEKCGKRFYDKGTLTSHMMLHDDTKKYKCEICKAGFRTASQLRTHVGIHGSEKPYACDQCGRTFRLRRQLTSHLIIHTDNLPHICEFCSKAFRFKSILTQHIRQHTGIKPYCCEHCLREFTNWSNFNKHMKRRHSIDTARKKHTPEGVFPINPLTGEILPLPDSSTTKEWKKKIMIPRRRGRPRMDSHIKDIKSNFEIDSQEKSMRGK